MKYRKIDGWFEDADFYREQVDRAEDGAHFVEVGSWQGRSAACMAELIAESGKIVRFDCVDNWQGSPGTAHDELLKGKPEGWLRERFERHLRDAGLWRYVNPTTGDSADTAERYEDKSLDFVFIDANHSAASVARDVAAWWPKVKPGGILGGHDWTNETVRQGVSGALPKSKVYEHGAMCWSVRRRRQATKTPPLTLPHNSPAARYCLDFLQAGFERLGCSVDFDPQLQAESFDVGPGHYKGSGSPYHIAKVKVGSRPVWFDYSDFTDSFQWVLDGPYLKVQATPETPPAGQFLTHLAAFEDALPLLRNGGPDLWSVAGIFANIDERNNPPLRRQFVEMFRDVGHSRVGLFRFSDSRPEVPAEIHVGQMEMREYWRLASRSRIHVALPGVGGDFTRRHLETMAMGVCLLTVETEQVWPGNSGGCWATMKRDLSDAEQVVGALLNDPEERERIAYLGRWYWEAHGRPAAMARRFIDAA